MIQPWKSFKNFDCWSNKAYKKYEDIIQIMTSLFFPAYQSEKHDRKFVEKPHKMN